MTFDTPAADAAPTRRSSRTGSAPVVASDEAVSSRAGRRRGRHGDAPVIGTPIGPVTTGGPEPLATIPAPLRAGLRSRARNTPLTDAEAEALSGAGLDAERPADADRAADAERAADAPVSASVPLTRRSARRTAPETAADPEPAITVDEALQPSDDTPAMSEETSADAPRENPAAAAETTPDGDAEEPADVFEAAVRMFGNTGETATITTDAATSASAAQPDATAPAATGHVGRGRGRAVVSARRITAASFSVGVMGIVGLLTVGMTTPVEAVAGAGSGDGPVTSIVALSETDDDAASKAGTDDIQAYVAPAEAASVELNREEGYAAVTMSELAVEAGVRDTSSTYVNNSASAVQYPFPVGVPISSPYGMRWGYLHAGVDFVPGGQGAEIHAIADGVVRVATEAGASYGVHVIIDHIVDGEVVSSHYAHMQYGSLKVEPGAVVKRGDVIGTVGTTGHSTGPHLHFEILLNGTTATEPMAWMAAHNVASTVVTVPEHALSTDQ